jgi:hypothetical protein
MGTQVGFVDPRPLRCRTPLARIALSAVRDNNDSFQIRPLTRAASDLFGDLFRERGCVGTVAYSGTTYFSQHSTQFEAIHLCASASDISLKRDEASHRKAHQHNVEGCARFLSSRKSARATFRTRLCAPPLLLSPLKREAGPCGVADSLVEGVGFKPTSDFRRCRFSRPHHHVSSRINQV